MSLAHAQFTVSPLQRGTNENGWRASSGPCVRMSEGTHVHTAISWWLLAERRGSDDLQVLGAVGPGCARSTSFPCFWFMFPLTNAVRQTHSHEPAQIQTTTHQMSISELDSLIPAVWVCVWVGGWWWSPRRRSMSWEKSDVQQRPRFPDFLCLTRFSLHERRNRIKMTAKNVCSIWKTSKASINIIKKTERINGVNVAQWIQD